MATPVTTTSAVPQVSISFVPFFQMAKEDVFVHQAKSEKEPEEVVVLTRDVLTMYAKLLGAPFVTPNSCAKEILVELVSTDHNFIF